MIFGYLSRFIVSYVQIISDNMNTPKWIPKLNDEVVRLFEQARNLERDFRVLGKMFTTDINVDLPDYYVSNFSKLFRFSFTKKLGESFSFNWPIFKH